MTARWRVLFEADGHIDHLYAHPDHTRRGLTAQLLAMIEMHARDHGITRLYTEASDLARPAFERADMLSRTNANSPSRMRTEVPIHNWAMEKPL